MDPVDADTRAYLAHKAKQQIRARMRSLRAAMSADAAEQRSAAICARLADLAEFAQASAVGLFWPMEQRREVDLRALDKSAREHGKRVYYPYMTPNAGGFETGFRLVTAVEQLVDRGQRFAEPPSEAPHAERGQIDLIVVPALAIASDGHRLGYGAGFYDVTLPDFCPPALTVAVAYDFQLLGELPILDTDVRCNFVVTDAKTFAAAR